MWSSSYQWYTSGHQELFFLSSVHQSRKIAFLFDWFIDKNVCFVFEVIYMLLFHCPWNERLKCRQAPLEKRSKEGLQLENFLLGFTLQKTKIFIKNPLHYKKILLKCHQLRCGHLSITWVWLKSSLGAQWLCMMRSHCTSEVKPK
jgi:hypothetical protein